jgi:RTX calcium-binding nonapeptide repeat (4 copies)
MPTAIPSRNSRAPRRAARPRLEALEPRLALAASATLGAAARVAIVGDTLTVEGTPGPDRIQVLPTRLQGTVRVAFDGKMLGNYGPVASIDVNAGAGNDNVTVDPRITLPTLLDGGPGNDRLRGGSGPNVLLGGGGNDTLIGNPSRDTLDGGPGTNRLVPLKSLGVVQVGPSASGAGLRRLSRSYTLLPLQFAGPAVVGAADLSNASTVAMLQNDYQSGQTVAIANATADQANALARLLGDPRTVALADGVDRTNLIAFRKITSGGQTTFSVFDLLPVANVATTPPQKRVAGARANELSDREMSSP